MNLGIDHPSSYMQQAEAAQLDAAIAENLKGIGYDK